MKDLQEIKARIIMMNANLSELMKLVFYEEGEPEPDEYPDEQPYIPKPGEVVEVRDREGDSNERIFVEYDKDKEYPFICVMNIGENVYRKGLKYPKNNWKFCRRLKGEIIPFGCDKANEPKQSIHASMKFEIDLANPESEIKAELTSDYTLSNGDTITAMSATDSEKADDIHDALKYLHLLPEGYCFCEEADAEKWVKVERMDWNEPQSPLGAITENSLFDFALKAYYRPICKIKPGRQTKPNERTSRIFNSSIDSPQVATDYAHLLPPGYEFCKEEEAEKWVKVNLAHAIGECRLGYIIEGACISASIKDLYRPIRLIKIKISAWKNYPAEANPNPYQVDWSNAPEWADSHTFDGDGRGGWYGCAISGDIYRPKWDDSTFTLPSGLDWKQSKTRRSE